MRSHYDSNIPNNDGHIEVDSLISISLISTFSSVVRYFGLACEVRPILVVEIIMDVIQVYVLFAERNVEFPELSYLVYELRRWNRQYSAWWSNRSGIFFLAFEMHELRYWVCLECLKNWRIPLRAFCVTQNLSYLLTGFAYWNLRNLDTMVAVFNSVWAERLYHWPRTDTSGRFDVGMDGVAVQGRRIDRQKSAFVRVGEDR